VARSFVAFRQAVLAKIFAIYFEQLFANDFVVMNIDEPQGPGGRIYDSFFQEITHFS
jgi:hypothetical protein